MPALRTAVIAGASAVALSVGLLVAAPAEEASAATASTSGLISRYERNYNTWRTKSPAVGVYFTGSASQWWDCCSGQMEFLPTDTWRLSLRTQGGNVIGSRTYTGRSASGLFPGTAGVTYSMVFAVSTYSASAVNTGDPEAVASFSGTFTY